MILQRSILIRMEFLYNWSEHTILEQFIVEHTIEFEILLFEKVPEVQREIITRKVYQLKKVEICGKFSKRAIAPVVQDGLHFCQEFCIG